MREQSGVRNFLGCIGNRCLVEVESCGPAPGQCAWQLLLPTSLNLSSSAVPHMHHQTMGRRALVKEAGAIET